MKHIFMIIAIIASIIFLNIIGSINRVYAQEIEWIEQTVPFTRGVLNAVDVTDENTGWAVGCNEETNAAVILHTVDGGEEWNMQPNTLTGSLYGLYMINNNLGFAVGQDWDQGFPAILKTTNGGNLWESQNVPEINGILEDVCFVDEIEGWAVGRNWETSRAYILHTEDGITWNEYSHTAPEAFWLAVNFVGNERGWIVGTDWDNELPYIIHTSDGGENWVQLDHPVAKGAFMDVCFISADTGFVAGYQDTQAVVLQTNNSGISWTALDRPSVMKSSDHRILVSEEQSTDDDLNSIVNSIDFLGRIGLAAHKMVGIEEKTRLDLITGFANTFIWEFKGSETEVNATIINHCLVQPLLQGAGTGYGVGSRSSGASRSPFVGKVAVSTNPSGIDETIKPTTFQLGQNYPNPFNSETVVPFQVSSPGRVMIKLYNIQGEEILTLIDGDYLPGSYRVHVDGRGLGSGIYLYRIKMEDYWATYKMILMR